MAKLIENTFRQVNIALVNELATIAPAVGVDIWEALEAAATKPFGYMPFWPGPGVGGHCIAIDPSYLSWRVEQRLGFGIGFIEHARAVNNRMPSHVVVPDRRSAQRSGAGPAGVTPGGPRPHLQGRRQRRAGVTRPHRAPATRGRRGRLRLPRSVRAGRDAARSGRPQVRPGVDVRCRTQLLTGRRLRRDPDRPPGIDYDAVVDVAPLVFDAGGATRHCRAGNVVLL